MKTTKIEWCDATINPFCIYERKPIAYHGRGKYEKRISGKIKVVKIY